MKKLILMTICALILNMALAMTTLAKATPSSASPDGDLAGPTDPAPTPKEDYKYVPLGEATFDVNKVLNLGKDQQTKLDTKGENSPLVAFILKIMNYATAIMGTIAMILLIIAGFMMMFSTGNQQTLDKAKDIVKYAVLGLAVAFLSYIIVIFIQSLFIPEPLKKP